MFARLSIKNKVLIAIILLLVGILFISWNYLLEKKNQVFETMEYELSTLPSYIESNVDDPDYVEEVITDEKTFEIEDVPVVSSDGKVTVTKNNYVGRLVIPKINFNRGFAAYGTKENDVDKNIAIMKGSSYPDVFGGNFIIAGHSGTMWFSYFKNLYKLKENNLAYVYYKDVKYTYKIVDIYKENKDGTILIKRDINKSAMTLITCTKDSRTKQTVYILEQIEKEYL